MFFRRSGARSSRYWSDFVCEKTRSRWLHSNVDHVFSHKRGYARKLGIEQLEDRRLLTVNVYVDNVTGHVTVKDQFISNSQQTPFQVLTSIWKITTSRFPRRRHTRAPANY